MNKILLLLVIISLTVSSVVAVRSHHTASKADIDSLLSEDFISEKLNLYISKNFDKVLQLIQNSKHSARANAVKNKILQHKDEIFDTDFPYFGNNDSNIMVVGFFDYSCGYCKSAKDHTKQLIDDGKVKYIFRDAPILGNNSLKAAVSALAVYFINKEKYLDFHYAALAYRGEFSDNDILNIVRRIGIDKNEFEKSKVKNAKKIEEMISSSRSLVDDLGVGGTPFLVVGDNLFVGVPDLDILLKKIDELSKN